MISMKAMHKDFWMEIRKSKARFISIFMIVALGVAFFSGIQASSPFDTRIAKEVKDKNETLNAFFRSLKQRGEKNIYFLSSRDIIDRKSTRLNSSH